MREHRSSNKRYMSRELHEATQWGAIALGFAVDTHTLTNTQTQTTMA